MNKVSVIVLIMLLSSCASKKRSEGKDIDDIKNVDFKKPQSISYSKNKDHYSILSSLGNTNDALIEETIHRSVSVKIDYEGLDKSEGELSQLAKLCYRRNFEEAFIFIDDIYLRYREHPSYWNLVGNCYFLQNDLRKSNLFYKQALKYDKSYVPAYNNIGNIHMRRNEHEKALAAFKKAHETNKNSLTPAYNLVQVYMGFGIIDQAQKILLNIESKRTGDPGVWGMLATTYLFQGNVKEGIKYFKRIPVKKLEDPSIGLNYAVALKIAGDIKSANMVFNDIDNNKKEWKVYYNKVKDFVR